MITVDFLSPGGAFTPAATGDTKELTTTFSITSGTNTLTCNGATPFVSGDVGKYFMLQGAGSSGKNSEWLFGTISGYTSSTVVTLSANATKTLTAASKILIWGTDDSPAVRAFNTWARAQSDEITLTFGAGAKNFIFASTDSNAPRSGAFAWNCPHPVTLQGNGGATRQTKFYITLVFRSFSFIAGNYIKSGNSTWGSSSMWVARLDSASAGTTTLQCKTIADASMFVSGTWALLSGMDLMGTGQPPNPFYYEYVKMTNVDTGTGVITLQDPLQNAYSDAWPHFNDGILGLEPDHGGPATLYVLDDGWGSELTVDGIEFVTDQCDGQMTTKGRKFTFIDVRYSDQAGLIPSGAAEVEFRDCLLNTYSMEIDKITEHVTFDNTQTGQLLFQSSVDRVIFRDSQCTQFNGTPRILTVENSTMNSLSIGALAFGRSDSFSMSGSTHTGAFSYNAIDDNGDNGGSSIQTDYTMTDNGVIVMPRSGRDYPGVRWAIPGTKCYFTGRFPAPGLQIISFGHTFTVTGVTADATNIYVQTDWPFTGGFRSWMTNIRVFPALSISVASDNTTSNAALINQAAATAAGYTIPGRYSFATLNGATCGTDVGSAQTEILPATGGKLVSLKVNVTTPYTGAQSTLDWGKATQFVMSGDGTTVQTWNPRFDLKTAGLRTITATGVSGAVGADALSAPPSNAWLTHWLQTMSTGSKNITSEYNGNPSVGPVFTVELVVNQTDVSPRIAPLRLRMHGL